MKIGYGRTSTADQQAGLEAQVRDLRAAGCEEVFVEQVSSVAKRDKLSEAMRFVRKGDQLCVTKICRLARSTADLLKIVADLEQRGVGLVILSMGGQVVDTSTPTGKLMVITLGSVAEFERSIMLERQKEGIKKAQQDGKYVGRQPTARAKSDQVLDLAAQSFKREDIAAKLGIGVASVYRILAEAKKAA